MDNVPFIVSLSTAAVKESAGGLHALCAIKLPCLLTRQEARSVYIFYSWCCVYWHYKRHALCIQFLKLVQCLLAR